MSAAIQDPDASTASQADHIVWFGDVRKEDVATVGAKIAALGELMSALEPEGVKVPDGFAITTSAYREFLRHNSLDGEIDVCLSKLSSHETLPDDAERHLRRLFLDAEFPDDLHEEIHNAYRILSKRYGEKETDVALRSSATLTGVPDASYAGQQETFLNVNNAEDLFYLCKRCFASLFTEHSLSYRDDHRIDHREIAVSVGVQKMVRADTGVSGTMFTLDTETGFPELVVINAAYGLGESIVQGLVTPDEYRIFKPLLGKSGKCPIIEKVLGEKEVHTVCGGRFSARVRTVNTRLDDRTRYALGDEQILRLARWGCSIEEHFSSPMNVEWALDGESCQLFLLQARPESVHSQHSSNSFRSARLTTENPKVITEGTAIGNMIASGKVAVVDSIAEATEFHEGQILVAAETTPDWFPLLRKAAGIITDHGGRTSHAAIVSRELGVPAVIGTEDASHLLYPGQEVTLSCAEGEHGTVYRGLLDYEDHEIDLENFPTTKTPILLNIGSRESAFRWWRLPLKGIGLARMEYLFENEIQIHPLAAARFDEITESGVQVELRKRTAHYDSPRAYFIDTLAMGLAGIAASKWPDPVIVRTSDFETRGYFQLPGGHVFENVEENPLIGLRGAARYCNEFHRPGFELECLALQKARTTMGLDNIEIAIPFCRTPEEGDRVLSIMSQNGLRRGENGLRIHLVAEVPANVILAAEFAKRFDGFLVDSSDLARLTLGADLNSEALRSLYDERNPAVETLIARLIRDAHKTGATVGICDQNPADHPDFADFLVASKIDFISLNPESVIATARHLSRQANHS